MRRFLTLFKKINTAQECVNHNTKQLPHILANENCITCGIDICYVCGNKHLEHGCNVKTAEISHTKIAQSDNQYQTDQYNAQQTINHRTLEKFNLGHLISVDLQKLLCICGKKITESDHSAFCVTCGSATCSNACHHNLIEAQEKCSFHQNFSVRSQEKSMRSIQLRNIYNLFDQGFASGTPINRTSQHFIMGYLSKEKQKIFIQRGYRQYGNPVEQTLNAMSIINAPLDYELNLFRQCLCKCYECRQRGYHPLISCEHQCRSFENQVLRDYKDDPEFLQICNCQCKFCSSGQTILKHRRIDCLLQCQHNPVTEYLKLFK